jgi:predicted dehydrogenase
MIAQLARGAGQPASHSVVRRGTLGAVRRVHWEALRTQPAASVATECAADWRVDPRMSGGDILFDHGWHALYWVMRWARRGA